MRNAGHERDLAEPGEQPDIERLTAEYIADAKGDTHRALRQAVADGIETARLVSRGFARWPKAPRVRS